LLARTTNRSKVLLVDDEPRYLELCAAVVEACGLSVLAARGPLEAIAIVAQKSEEIRVAVVDYHMPNMNGCRLANCLRSINPDIKIVLHSGATDIPGNEMTSVDAVVPKGCSMEACVEDLTQWIERDTKTPRNTRASKKRGLN